MPLASLSALSLEDVIVAPSAPVGGALRGIVRASGREVLELLGKAWPDVDWTVLPGRASKRRLCLPPTGREVPVTIQVSRAPRSATGQDVVELHLPGSPPVIQALVEALTAAGARPAEAGEFTLRAYLNGKLDLAQAEAVAALIDAEHTADARLAMDQLTGGLSQPIHAAYQVLLELLADVEASLDFVEEDIQFITRDELRERLGAVIQQLDAVQNQLSERRIDKIHPRVVLAGPPNSGKSALFNRLAVDAVALSTAVPGTTRDVVHGSWTVGNMRVDLWDTAGEDAARDVIAQQAQHHRARALEQADLILYCVDLSQGLLLPESPRDRQIVVGTKLDVALGGTSDRVDVATSSVTGQGIDALTQTVAERLRDTIQPGLLAPRCAHAVASAQVALRAAKHNPQTHLELLAVELRTAVDELGRLAGATDAEDLLGLIFSRFCIGK